MTSKLSAGAMSSITRQKRIKLQGCIRNSDVTVLGHEAALLGRVSLTGESGVKVGTKNGSITVLTTIFVKTIKP